MTDWLNRIESGIATKYLIQVHETSAEVTRVERPDKTIICFSTQIGCPIGCKFCASGMGGSSRSLTMAEMYRMIQIAYRDPASPFMQDSIKPLLLSAMGEGEPAFCLSHLDRLFNLTITNNVKGAVSTSAPSIKLLKRMCDKFEPLGIKIQYSLHSADQRIRRLIMPNAKANPIEVLEVLCKYPKVELNVVLFEGMNDSAEDCTAIINLLDQVPNDWKIKLNRGNQIQGGPKPAGEDKMALFADQIATLSNYEVEMYFTDGADINAACGQLRTGGTGYLPQQRAL